MARWSRVMWEVCQTRKRRKVWRRMTGLGSRRAHHHVVLAVAGGGAKEKTRDLKADQTSQEKKEEERRKKRKSGLSLFQFFVTFVPLYLCTFVPLNL